VTLQPGEDLLFSLPLEHVRQDAFIRVDAHIESPQFPGKLQPGAYVEFDLARVPVPESSGTNDRIR
jgi:hypothetical protein